jgi:hypothetical protein
MGKGLAACSAKIQQGPMGLQSAIPAHEKYGEVAALGRRAIQPNSSLNIGPGKRRSPMTEGLPIADDRHTFADYHTRPLTGIADRRLQSPCP